MKKTVELWHPDSPGEKVIVTRGFWAGLFCPKDFATIKETIKFLRQLKG